jgi:zinc transporter ZupT
MAAIPAGAQETPTLVGSVNGTVYTSPTGAFRMEVPVLPALGGVVRDTANVVTFRDSFGLQISIGAFAHDATQRWELSTRGIKDYLIYYFGTYVLPDFKRFCPSTTIESAGFSADLVDGALFTYILLPGGSMFEPRPAFGQVARPAVAKRGNLLFVKNGFTYVISTELSERVTEGSHYSKNVQEEDQALRSRLVDLVKKMQFSKPPTPEKAAPAQTTPATP